MGDVQSIASPISPPFWLLAELTYRCPLHCVFCYNPVDYATQRAELDTASWLKALSEARELGAVQLGFSGGEPLLRDDLEILVEHAHQLGFYTNLITSGVGLNEKRIVALKEAGLDHIQLSFQDSTREMNDFLSSTKTFDLKRRVAALIKKYDYPMVMNCVLHRYNLPHVSRIIDMALEMGAEYLELANTQYYGWAKQNRAHLMPTRSQIEEAERVVADYRARIGNQCRLLFVVPDYFESRPKACMDGWGRIFLGIAPDGAALPCHNARQLPGLDLPNVQDTAIRDIWYDSPAFNAFRGSDWMQEPCRSCDEKDRDFGGCRCQAYMIAGHPAATDPVCTKSPHRVQVDDVIARALNGSTRDEHPIVFRTDAQSLRLSAKGNRAGSIDSS